ncbi:S8 family serine peptidase [Streptomyces sp. NBC_01619]|uniref:S8 family serine peptidase n=1 Tax=Streptomyces sp. NBC_01619 TaxID=2975901 RepID=UPI00224D593B|nr:S8 family serine peptidase [Streptomyces sp. NBC_01619]MCX4513927.1 S8 family serine peptidase [Streptomyces sp. NBC_01619]
MRSTNRWLRLATSSPHHRSVAIAALTAVLVGMAAPGAAQQPRPGRAAPSGDPRPSVHTVTLITGDRVTVSRYADGRQVASVLPAHGRESGGFSTREVDGRIHVTPVNAVPYLSSGQLDAALFDVTGLIEQGYDDSHAKQLPLLLRYGASARLSAQKAPAGVERRRVLDSVDGVAVDAAKGELDDFWKAVRGTPDKDAQAVGARGAQKARTASAAPRLAGALEKIWLDRKVKVSLDRSVAQVGAPEVWKTGVTGKGVKVAVLDTGIDTTHPDLAGRVGETRNFSASDSTRDLVGHGTHVAATIAGSGAGANGTRKGVAPDAELVVGKVLDDTGSGSYSDVLAGMEWAARSGARVVNMSLGGPASDDDPLVTAVETLTKETGALFVVAAGNEGPGTQTVGSPGTAPSALTVGAVDRDDSLAEFSSRGPVGAADAVKPDLTAPGVGIVAARAAGTLMGSPESDLYTAASGTSMATPHVAGAAALLAQRHPAWTPEAIKNALVGSSKTVAGQGVDEQGGGRLDVAGAFGRGVVATGTVNLGMQEPDGAGVTQDVSYTNVSERPVRLALSLQVKDHDGTAAPTGAFTAGSSSVTVAPGETVRVPVTARAAGVPLGRYSGYLTATPDDGTAAVHTAVSMTVRGAMRKLTLRFIDREGRPGVVPVLEMYGSDHRYDLFAFTRDGTVEVTLPADTYFLKALVPGDTVKGWNLTQVLRPELTLDRDMEVVLDARTAKPIEVRTPKASEQQGMIHFGAYRAVGIRKIASTTVEFDSIRTVFATPTAKTAKGTFEFYSRWRMVAPRLMARVQGSGAPELNPVLFNYSPGVDGTRRLPVVLVEPESLAGKNLRGKAVLMRTNGAFPDQVAAVARTGAAALMIINEFPGPVWQPWTPTGERDPLITMHVPQEQGEALAAWLKRQGHRETTLELSGTSASPHLYDLALIEKEAVRSRLSYQVSDTATATVEARYHRPGAEGWTGEQRFAWRPWQGTSFVMETQSSVKLPSARTETVSAGDTVWLERVTHKSPWNLWGSLGGGMTGGLHQYAAGQRLREDWYGAVVRPAAPAGNPAFRSVRAADTFDLRLAEFADGDGHYAFAGDDETDKVRTRLYRDGTQLADQIWPWGAFPAGSDKGSYRLRLETSRTSPSWAYSTRTDTSWSFRSTPPAAGERELMPLVMLDYDVPVDVRNEIDGSSSAKFRVTARHQDGWTGARIAGMRVWASTDDGAHWVQVPVSKSGNGSGSGTYDVRLDRSVLRHADSVSLRVKAWDGSGNDVDQTVVRAFGVR